MIGIKHKEIRTFADSVDKILSGIDDEVKKEKILKWSRSKADWIYTLLAKQYELFGENKNISLIIRVYSC